MGNARDFFCFLPEIPPQAGWRLDILLFAMLGNTVFGGGNARDFFLGLLWFSGSLFCFFQKFPVANGTIRSTRIRPCLGLVVCHF